MTFKNLCDVCGKEMIAPYIVIQEVTTETQKKWGFKKRKTLNSCHHQCLNKLKLKSLDEKEGEE